MEFRGLTLDRFQTEAIAHVDEHKSVVVSAATGTGKTLIADYVIDKALRDGKKVFYTAPIKALSNQKYSQFKRTYGEHSVGILTGDVVINAQAQLLIMTTEIYRNMLLVEDPITDDLQAVIFDEIHYLGDRERGTVWEEAIIFSPGHVRFLCLSATIPNARQFANWIESIKSHKVEVVTEKKRAVPLKHLFYDNRFGASSLDEIRERKRQRQYPSYKELYRSKRRLPETQQGRKLTHVELIEHLHSDHKLPCIYFCFSRALTEKKAEELAERHNFLSGEERGKVAEFIDRQLEELDPSIARLDTTRRLLRCLESGVSFHHAGLLPALKELTEQIFESNLLRVLYATETFAVGINLPAKTVCFDSLEKYDGFEFRYLRSSEYFQLAGRAGRRGMDKVGFVYSYVDPEFADLDAIAGITTHESEQLRSQYTLSYNTVLNLIATHTPEEREVILKSSFFTYQQRGKPDRMLKRYDKMRKKLERLGYLSGDDLAPKGEFARRIYQNELLITELFASKYEWPPQQMLLLIAAMEYEPRRNVRWKKAKARETQAILEELSGERRLYRFVAESELPRIEQLVMRWAQGASFAEVLELTTLPEGDIVRFFRRLIDVLSQILHASHDSLVRERVEFAIAAVDRDIVRVRL